MQPHGGVKNHPKTLLDRASGSAFDMHPSPEPCGTTDRHRLSCLRLLAPRWSREHHLSFTISQRWDRCEDRPWRPRSDPDHSGAVRSHLALICARGCWETMNSNDLTWCPAAPTNVVHEKWDAIATSSYRPRYVCLGELHSSADALIRGSCPLGVPFMSRRAS